MDEKITEYDLEYMGVKCTGAKWRYPEQNIFYFIKDGKDYEFTQMEDVDCIADTDHIRCVIEDQFLPWLKDERIKAKIVEIALHAEWTDMFGDHYSIGESAANAIADVLIAAGIGDVKEYESLKIELRQKVDYIHELWEVKEDYKHRAEVAERALKDACTNVIKDEEDDLAVEPRVNVLYKAYLRQAEKELAEEGK